MHFELDRVPSNLDEAVQIICNGIGTEEIEFINEHNPICLHHTFGQHIRNSWSLWEKDTILVQWFVSEYRLSHADDISSIILDCVWAKIKNEEPNTNELVHKYKQYWCKLGKDPANVE